MGASVHASKAASCLEIRRIWQDDAVQIVFPKALTTEPLPDSLNTVAFMDGPMVLAGVTDQETTLVGDPAKPESILIPDRERYHNRWLAGRYSTISHDPGIKFMPLCDVVDETYTVYFPVRSES